MDEGNRLLVFCVWAKRQRGVRGGGKAQTQLWRREWYFNWGDQRWWTLPVPIMAIILLPLPLHRGQHRLQPWGKTPSTYWPLNWPDITPPVAGAFISTGLLFVSAWTTAPGTPRATVTTMGQQPDKATHTWQRSQGLLCLQYPFLGSSSPLHLPNMRLKKGLI